jgi:PatG C-terminal
MTIEGLETYILLPRIPGDFDLLVGAVRPIPNPSDIDVVIGVRGPMAAPGMCNGLQVPVVAFDQIYSFDRETLIKALPKPEKMSAKEFTNAAEEMFDRIQQMADNAGATDEHRALNYLAVRYPAIYTLTAEAFGRSSSLQAVNVLPSRLSGVRKVVDVVFSYTNRVTDVIEKYFVRVDVSDEFPFLVTKMSPYYDRQ